MKDEIHSMNAGNYDPNINKTKSTNKPEYAQLLKVKETENDEQEIENSSSASNVEQQCSTVVKRKSIKYKKAIICTGSKTVNESSKVKGALKRKWLYVGRICGLEVTEADITDFLENHTGNNDFQVKKLTTKGNNSAFSIGVPSDFLFAELYKPEFWPNGVVLREFNFRNFFHSKKSERLQ